MRRFLSENGRNDTASRPQRDSSHERGSFSRGSQEDEKNGKDGAEETKRIHCPMFQTLLGLPVFL
jgi:hypothetical protein